MFDTAKQLINENSSKDYNAVDYYLHFKYEHSPWWSFIGKYNNIDTARKCIDNHKLTHIKSCHSDKKIMYRIMQVTKDIKCTYE